MSTYRERFQEEWKKSGAARQRELDQKRGTPLPVTYTHGSPDPVYVRVSLDTNQHILYLLLSVFTCGLFIPVWIILAMLGKKVPIEETRR